MDNIKQESTNEIPAIICPNEPHMAVLFLLDTSKSIGDDSISLINETLNRFKLRAIENSLITIGLDVAIIAFNSSYHIIQEFVPVKYMNSVNLVITSSESVITPVIKKALEMIKEKICFYYDMGVQPYRPWVVLITDGNFNDEDLSTVVQEIKSMEDKKRLIFLSLGIGDYDSKALRLLSGRNVLELTRTDFSEFFEWILSSDGLGCSLPDWLNCPGEKPVLPDNIIVDMSTE